MTGPIDMLSGFSLATSLWIALVIGFFFGFVLERAGFGDSRNLAAQFSPVGPAWTGGDLAAGSG